MADIDFDKVLTQIGERGPFQTRLFYLLCFPSILIEVFLSFNQVFVSATPDHWCRVPELDTSLSIEDSRAASIPFTLKSDGSREYSHCEMYDVNFTQIFIESQEKLVPNPSWNLTKCKNGWHYDRTYYDETLVSQLDIVCDKSWWIATSTTCFYVMSLFGNVAFGLLGDKLGRRTALLIVIAWYLLLSIPTAFSRDYIMYTAFRSLNGLIIPAVYQVPFVLLIEMVSPKHRTLAGMLMCVLFPFGLALLAVLTLILRNWFSLLLYTSVPFVSLIAYYWLIPESPRWLLCKGRIDEAEVIVQRMAKVNGYTIGPDYLRTYQEQTMVNNSVNQSEQAKLKETEQEKTINVGIIDLLKRPVLRRCLIVVAFCWLSNAIVYNGFMYNSGNLGVNDQIAFLIGAVVELPGTLFGWWAMDRYGRIRTIWVSMLIGGLACIGSVFLPEGQVWITVTLAMFGRFGISVSFGVIYVYAGEVLPTVVRTRSLASVTFVSNIGLLVFPSIVHLANYWRPLPMLIFGTLSISGGLAASLLPETLGQPLPQTLEDGETLYKVGKKNIQPQRGNRSSRPI